MKTKKKFILSKKLYIILSTSLLAITMLALCFGGIFNQKESSKFIAYTDYYKSSQYAIESIDEVSSNSIISLTDAITYTNIEEAISSGVVEKDENNKVTITISSKEELHNFSKTIEEKSVFASYNYVLTSNIDYEGASPFIPIEEFSGSFNGMGYEIENLSLDSASENGYVSMFAKTTENALVTRFGLSNPFINVESDNDKATFVAPICGENNGEISYTFVRDLRNPETHAKAGMLVNKFIEVSGLVYRNLGNLYNSYTAFDIIVNRETVDSINQFSEILTNNEGTISNLFFFHDSIEKYISKEESEIGKTEIKYDSGTINKEFEYDNHFGTYCATLGDLNTNVTDNDSNSVWYYSGDYGSLATNLTGIVTPISRGILYDDESKTFTISSVSDYSYMYELMNLNAAFAAKDITYKITTNINLALIPKENYQYKFAIASTITGIEIPASESLVISTNKDRITYPTIYNATVDKITTEGIDCYGVFSYVSGTISNLNIANSMLNLTNSSNIHAVGLAVGYLDGGTINNVNTFGDITFESNIGKFYVGHTVGLAAGGAAISNVTASGNITNNSGASSETNTPDYMKGSAIGGILGYATSTLASLNTCLSETNITSATFTFTSNTSDIAIGGILGAGYTNVSANLENIGDITITGNSSNLYVAGIIGRHLGMKSQSSHFNNEGNVTVTLGEQTNAMVCGVVNADITTKADGNLAVSPLKLNGRFQYDAAAFTNGADIIVKNKPSSTNLEYTNVLNINSVNGFESSISGIYNLQYNSDITDLGSQTISMNLFNEFAPVVNVNSSNIVSASQKVDASTVYNLRSLIFSTNENLSTTELKYSGCMLGDYINYTNVRNEGDMTFNVSHTITATSFKAFGVFESVTAGYTATTIFNGGNIDLDVKNTITANVYFSGICYANRNGYTTAEINQFNPTNLAYDSSKTGSLNNTINNGIISVKSNDYTSITYDVTEIESANGQSTLGNSVETSYSNTSIRIDGDLYVSGIATINESVITNTFNLGDLYAANYITSTADAYEVNAGGISVLNIGMYAYILNSANSGNIKAINMSTATEVDDNTVICLSDVQAAGISCRNDLLENGTDYSGNTNNSNSKQLISFTINYGSVYSYNYRYNITSSAEEPNAKSAGILAMGLCNVINVVNYGNIYGSETASGIFGIVYFRKFQNEVTSNINIANTINYGNVYMLERGYNYWHDKIGASVDVNTESTMPDAKCASYSTFMAFTDDTVSSYAKTSIVRNTQYISVIGSIFSIVNFNTSTNANNVKIRYLISFNDLISIVGYATAIPSNVNVDVSSFYSAYYKINAKTGASQLDEWMGKFVNYIPLSTSEVEMNVVTQINNDESVVTAHQTYQGAFSEEFSFRLAIEGDENYLDINNYPTDAFISDYFQFVGYKFVNENLLDRIGWKSIAYITAANDFAQNMEAVTRILDKVNNYSTFSTEALLADSWMVYASNKTMESIINILIEECSLEELQNMLGYIFSDSSKSNILVTTELRENIYEIIVENSNNLDTKLLLNSILVYEDGYSSVLSSVILDNNDEVTEYLNNYISNLSQTTIEELLSGYIEYLETNSNSYFDISKNETARFNILSSLFNNVDDDLFYEELIELIGASTNAESSNIVKMYSGYSTLDNEDKKALFDAIINSNNYSKISTYLDVMDNDISYYSGLIDNGYNVTSIDQIITNADITSGSTSTVSSVIDQRIELWNQIKDTSTFEDYFSGLYNKTIFKATEYNNTYQSITEPHNEGAYVGDTSERLSYYYTTNVTPQTYFYGPYKNSEGGQHYNSYNQDVNSLTGGYTSLFHYSDESLWSSNELMKSRGGDESTTTYASYLNDNVIIMYYDYANEQIGEANKSVTLNGITFKGFETDLVSNSKTLADPMNNVVYNTSDWTGVEFTKNNWTMTVAQTGETFSLSDGAITGIYYAGGGSRTLSNGSTVTVPNVRLYVRDSNGTYHPVYGSYTLTNGTTTYTQSLPTSGGTTLYDQYSFICYLVGKRYYTSSAIENTGIFRRAQPWGSSQYFTWKQSNNEKVYTSQYIDYTTSDILNLDGYLTEYKEAVVQSNDERDIINKMFNDYLCTSSNVNNFKMVIKKALLESLGNHEANGTNFIDNFLTSNIYSDKLINSNHPLTYLNYTNSQTVSAYLMSLSQLTDDNNKSKLINAAVSDQTTYIKLVKIIKEVYNLDNNSNYIDYDLLLTEINNNNSLVDSNGEIVLNQLSGKTTTELQAILNPFDDNSNNLITLNGITGNNINSIVNQATINDIQYNYGIVFDSITINCTTSDVRLIFDAVSTSGTVSLNYTCSNGTTGSINISTANTYTISIANVTSITLSSNGNVIIYNAYVEEEDYTQTGQTYPYTATNSANTMNVSSNNIITSISSSLGTNAANISDLAITSGTAVVTNSTNFSRSTVSISTSENTTNRVTGTATVNRNSTETFDFTNLDFLDKTLYVGYGNNFTTNDNLQITSVTLIVTYSLLVDGTKTNKIVNDDIARYRLLNLSMPSYENIQKCYVSAVLKENNVDYVDYLEDTLFNFVPVNTSGDDSNPINILINTFDESQKEEFIRLLIGNYNSCLVSFIKDTCNTKEILKNVYEEIHKDSNNYHYLADAVIYGNTNGYFNDNVKKVLTAAYITADYANILNQSQSNDAVTVYNTKYRELLDNLSSSYRYINSNGSFDNNKFDDLLVYLEYAMSTSGYGIYALSSSKGILNGEFIPDNIVLDDMDSDYETSGNIFKLSDSLSSNWRGGNDSNENDTSNKESVNYAVLVEMKQLKKSIGTTIFEFDLEDNNGVIHYSSESSIDLENGIITYYVPTGYFNNVSKTLTIVEDTISVSNLAQISMMNNLSTDLRKDGNVNTITISNALALEDAIRVIAEDTTVYKDYTIQFVEMDIEFDLIYNSVSGDATINSDTSATVAYKDGVVILSLTSDTLPQNMDLTPYIDIYQGTTKMDRDTSFVLSNEEGDHVINSSHDAIITMKILSSLPAGEYTIVVDIFGEKKELELIKNPSEECEILEFEYDGVDITSELSDGSHTNYIDFGRAFDYEELTNPTSESFYLNRFKVSENATVVITAEKTLDNDGLLTYTVTYRIAAEAYASTNDENYVKIYTHILIEKHPFKSYDENGPTGNDFLFATYYEDGDSITSSTYNIDDEYYNSNNNTINVEFDRGFEPQYRVKYTLSNFYLLGSDMDQLFTIDASGAVGATYNKTYGGITAVVTDTCEAGVYTFLYVYNNSGTWSDGNYDRTWEFPAFVITKNYSKDATLNNITYIDGMSMLSSTSTVISATQVFRPSGENISNSDEEVSYYEYEEIESKDKPIEAEGDMINYANISGGIDYASIDYTDYFLIGSLSNAKLAYYAPIFKIEEHAEIYQYTTRYKLDNYGKEGYTDMDILTKHTDTISYIYVPYTDGVDIEIFLVQVDANNNWTNVYTVESNATGAIATLTENKGSFTYDNKTYTVDESAGKPTNNTSLYMDYIGTPLEDHFWYVSYVVFSEDALHNNDSEYIKYFHLSLIDLTNNIYFEVQVNAPVDFALEDIYITFAAEGVATQTEGVTTTKQLSAYVTKTSDRDGEYVIYLLDNEIQILPSGYYYFYLDLPNGYKVTYEITNGKDNRNENADYEGAYLPPSSIVTQRIAITFTIEADEESADIWGVSTSEIYSRVAVEVKE